MTYERFTIYHEAYQDTDDMGRAIAPPFDFYIVGNSKISFNFDNEEEANRLMVFVNDLINENDVLKQQTKTKYIVNKQYEELKQFKNLANDYNIPFDKLYDVFEKSIDWDCETDCRINAIQLLRENENFKRFFKELKSSGYWNDDYLTEQDWLDVKLWINNVVNDDKE